MSNLFKKIVPIFLIGVLMFLVYSTAKAEEVDEEKNGPVFIVLDKTIDKDDDNKGGFWGWSGKLNKFFSDNWDFFTLGSKEKSTPVDILEQVDENEDIVIFNEEDEEQKEKGAIETIEELIGDVENYYEFEFIEKEWVKDSLIKDLKKSILGLEKIEDIGDSIWFNRKRDVWEKSVILRLKTVVFKIRLYNNYIDDDVTDEMIETIEEIEEIISSK